MHKRIRVLCKRIQWSLFMGVVTVASVSLTHAEPSNDGTSTGVSPLLMLTGSWQQGGLIFGTVEAGTQVKFLTHRVPVTEDGRFVLGLGRDAPPQVELTLTNTHGVVSTQSYAVRQRDYDIQKIEGVPARTVNPDPIHIKRIRNEVWMTKKAREKILDRIDYLQPFQWPTIGRISGVYGSQRFYNGEARRPHFGVDVAVPTGTKVKAPVAGVVTLAHNDMFFSGGTLILDHGHGLSSSFLHLSKILVNVGDEITQGQDIAEVGATGRVTGPHLDWRMNWFDQRVDPQLLVEPMPH